MIASTYLVKPGYRKGGKGCFTRLATPCEFEIRPEIPPTLHTHYYPFSNFWLALLATIVTSALVKEGLIVGGPGLIVWYLIINALRRRKLDIDLTQVERVIADPMKKEISVLRNISGKKTWVGLKCGQHFTSIVDALKNSGRVPVSEGMLQSSQMGMIILLVVVFLALIALIMVAVAKSR